MLKTLRARATLLRDDESGLAMVVVMGVIAFMTVIAIAGFAVASQSVRDTTRVQEATQAFQAANSGVDHALTRIQTHGFYTTDYPVSGSSSTGATFTATVAPTSNSEYICTSVGRDKNGAIETIKVKFFYLNMWNMNLAAGTNNALGGGSVKGTTSVYGPFYVRGSVDLGSNSTIESGPLFIKDGSLTITGSGQIGGNGPIDVYVTGAYPPVGSKGMNARSVSQSVPDITLPLLTASKMISLYEDAKGESDDNIQGYSDSGLVNLETTGSPVSYRTMLPGGTNWLRPKAPGASSYYKSVSGDSAIAALGAGTHSLTIGGTGSFGSWSGDGHYTKATHDDFSYDDSANLLTVEGTVFIDGPLILNENMTYRGNGALVVNGDITINGDFLPATGNSHPDATHVIGIVTPGNIVCNAGDGNPKDPTEKPNVAGAFFCSKDWSMSQNLLVKGSVLAGSITFAHPNQHLVTDPNLPSYLPRAMPGSGESVLTKGSWVR